MFPSQLSYVEPPSATHSTLTGSSLAHHLWLSYSHWLTARSLEGHWPLEPLTTQATPVDASDAVETDLPGTNSGCNSRHAHRHRLEIPPARTMHTGKSNWDDPSIFLSALLVVV